MCRCMTPREMAWQSHSCGSWKATWKPAVHVQCHLNIPEPWSPATISTEIWTTLGKHFEVYQLVGGKKSHHNSSEVSNSTSQACCVPASLHKRDMEEEPWTWTRRQHDTLFSESHTKEDICSSVLASPDHVTQWLSDSFTINLLL